MLDNLKRAERGATIEVIKFGLFGFLGIALLYVLQRYILGGQFLGNLIIETPALYCLLIWIAFTIFSSTFEAFYYTHEINSGFQDNFNEHTLLTIMRFSALIPLWILTDWKFALCYVMMFPFLHDGNYYRWRDKIKPGTYKRRWFAQSTTSTAWTTKIFTPLIRTILAIGALTWLITML